MFFGELEPERLEFALEEDYIVQFGVNGVSRAVVKDDGYLFLDSYGIGSMYVNVGADVFNLNPWEGGLGGADVFPLLRFRLDMRDR